MMMRKVVDIAVVFDFVGMIVEEVMVEMMDIDVVPGIYEGDIYLADMVATVDKIEIVVTVAFD